MGPILVVSEPTPLIQSIFITICFCSRLFSDVTLPLMDKPILKIPSKLKEFIRTAKDDMEKRLHEEQKVVSTRRRHKVKPV